MKEYQETGHTSREHADQKETGASSSWASKFLGLPSKMGGWVIGKKSNSSETVNHPLPLQDSPSLFPPPSSIFVASSSEPYEISEDEEEPNYLDLINENDIGGLAEEMNMTFSMHGFKGDTMIDGENVNKEREDVQGKLKNQVTDQSDSVSTDSFASVLSPPDNCNKDFTLVKIKEESLDEEEVMEVDKNGRKVKVVKFPVLELEELFRCKRELDAIKCAKRVEEEKFATLQQESQIAPVELEATASSASASRRNPGRSVKTPNKEKGGKTEKSEQKSAIKELTQRHSKKMEPSLSATTKETKPNVGELSCLECNRTFIAKSGLRNHELSHKRSNGQFKCNVCGKDQFKTAHHLRQHEVRHFPVETCIYCEKKFGSRSNLANHQRTSKVCKAIRQNGVTQ